MIPATFKLPPLRTDTLSQLSAAGARCRGVRVTQRRNREVLSALHTNTDADLTAPRPSDLLSSGLASRPFAAQGLGRRVTPFALMLLLAEASLVLPPGPRSQPWMVASLVLLLLTGSIVALSRVRFTPSLEVVVPILGIATICAMVIAGGEWNFGFNVVFCIPLAWASLYHRRRDTFIVVGAIVLAQFLTSEYPARMGTDVTLRRVILWGGIGLLVAVETHSLRRRLTRVLTKSMHLTRRSQDLELASEQLSALTDPDEVLSRATHLLDDLCATFNASIQRVSYYRSDGTEITKVLLPDEQESDTDDAVPIEDLPFVAAVARTGIALHGMLPSPTPDVATGTESPASPEQIYVVPVTTKKERNLILATITGECTDPEELLKHLVSYGHVVELALANAQSHETLIEEASTDALTGLPNRRVFNGLLGTLSQESRFSILTLDADGLKAINDSYGHAAGDEYLLRISRVVSAVMRTGDVLARVGGDEFAAILFDSNDLIAQEVVVRVYSALRAEILEGHNLRVSIGIASCTPGSDPATVLSLSDAAMYRVKREGGNGYAFAEGESYLETTPRLVGGSSSSVV